MSQTPTTALGRGPSDSWQQLLSRYLDEYIQKINLAVARLTDDQIWWRPHENALSVGNLLLHLHGNLSLWILQSFGGVEFDRDRAGEFRADRSHTKQELLDQLFGTVSECRLVVEGLSDEVIGSALAIQTYDTDVRSALFHAVEHMSYHTGQILYIAKALTSAESPFDFYPQHQGE